jgi:hypothetical protein
MKKIQNAYIYISTTSTINPSASARYVRKVDKNENVPFSRVRNYTIVGTTVTFGYYTLQGPSIYQAGVGALCQH